MKDIDETSHHRKTLQGQVVGSCSVHSVSKEGIWTVQKVVLDHNHYLASPNKLHKLKSQQRVTEADRMLISQIREAGVKPAQVYE